VKENAVTYAGCENQYSCQIRSNTGNTLASSLRATQIISALLVAAN